MDRIIPYDESLSNNHGALISPDGKILYVQTTHEVFAKKYCCGLEYDKLRYIKNCSSDLLFDEFKEAYSFSGNRKDIDEWSFSNLTKKDLELYKIWLKKYSRYHGSASSLDFMVLYLGYDKVESIKKNFITTTSKIPHVRFFNYYLMDWDVLQLPKSYYDDNEKIFKFKENDSLDFYHSHLIDQEKEEEIETIKAKVKKKDIPYFFR